LKIRRLDIIGFKSFAERTTLRFEDGTTGIVGPNGCGKSNVVDAIRWVMGEQSARRLRGKCMEDIIFNGSQSKLPMGMSEVRLTFHNDGRNIPPEYAAYSEITVGRRLFRTGESEYSINRTPCRLLDVQELFMGTGVGTRAYSIIGQGKIGLIVSQKPQERRTLIEEAAGISKYNARKRVAERKMEQTRQNLLRVNDVVLEIKRNINSLKRQARKAARYNKLKAQLHDIELHIAAHNYLELQVTKRHLDSKHNLLFQNEAQVQANLASLEATVEQQRTRLLDDDRHISQSQEELLSVDNQIKLSEKNIEFLSKEVESLTDRGQRSTQEIEDLKAEVGKLSESIIKNERSLSDLDEISEAAANRLSDRETSHQSQQVIVEELLSSIDSCRQSQLSLGGQTGELRSLLATLDQRLIDLEGRLGQAEAERAALQTNFDEGSVKKRRQAERLNQSRQLHLDLIQRRESTENSLADLEAQTKENEARLIALREQLQTRRSRLESLEEIERNYEGCQSGVRWVMRNAQARQESSEVLGLVADILQAPPHYETAVQAVLGDRLQSVVVKSQSAGLASVDYLKKESEGRSSFIPISLRDSEDVDLSKVAGPGVIGPMHKLVEFKAEYDSVIQYLLGDVVVIEDLTTAMNIWSANGNKATLVTLDGDVLDPQGVLTGGSLEGTGTHLLENKREIRELTDKLRHLDAEYRMVQDRQGKLKAQLVMLASTIDSLRQNSHDEEIRIVDQQKDLSHLSGNLENITQRVNELNNEISDLQNKIANAKLDKQQSSTALAENSVRQEELENKIRDSRQTVEAEKRTLATLSEELMELKVQAAASLERHQSARRDLDNMTRTRSELNRRIQRMKDDISSGNLQSVQGRQQIQENRDEISSSLARRERLQAELSVLRDAYEKLLAEVRENEIDTKKRRQEHEQLSQELADTHTRSREIDIELLHLSGDVKKSLKVDIHTCLATYHLMAPPTDEQHARAQKLKSTIERMGDVNPHAVETYEDYLQRYEFLTTQSQDLNESLEKLHKVIIKINRTSRKRFREAFESINNKFMEVFPKLFSGGKAHLKLEDDKDVLEAGVEIVVQPPGKKLQNMELLSGGEKALTAVALLFSIFLIKPTPFCLLDEVDAPLDDANLGRFNNMVKAMAANSQFILITHNKHTMEVVDRLYGITMEEPGISTVVSVQLTTHEEQLEKAS
jgi:chromosome segregation protein